MRITIEQVTKRFGQTTALAGVSIEVASGELFFLLGSSGCGKTTLLRILAGFYDVDAGSIRFDGRDMTAVPPHRRNTAMVFQGYALWPHMTVAENVAFGLEMRNEPRPGREVKVAQALDQVRIADLADRRPHQLSGGQQQRVALARTLVVQPSCLLLDEPLANLDAKLRLEMRAEIRRICKENGLTAVYVTHDQKEALSMADRLAIMDRGSMLQVGTPRQVYLRPVNRFVASFIGETNFVPATVVGSDGGCRLLDTALGRIRTTALPTDLAKGQAVTVSIRPEAFVLLPDSAPAAAPEDNVFAARLTDSVYLGEMAQHRFAVGDAMALKAYEMNPREGLAPGIDRRLRVAAEDVVVLAESPVGP